MKVHSCIMNQLTYFIFAEERFHERSSRNGVAMNSLATNTWQAEEFEVGVRTTNFSITKMSVSVQRTTDGANLHQMPLSV